MKKIIGILLCSAILLSGTAIVFASDTAEPNTVNNISIKKNNISETVDKKEPLARLQVITDKKEISKITCGQSKSKKVFRTK